MENLLQKLLWWNVILVPNWTVIANLYINFIISNFKLLIDDQFTGEAEKGWKKNTLRTKSRPSGRLDSWSPPATARSTLARRPRREIELMRGGGHHGGGWVGHHHHGHGGWHGHRHVGIRGGILGGIFGRPLYRCRFVNRWGRCLDRHPIYGR